MYKHSLYTIRQYLYPYLSDWVPYVITILLVFVGISFSVTPTFAQNTNVRTTDKPNSVLFRKATKLVRESQSYIEKANYKKSILTLKKALRLFEQSNKMEYCAMCDAKMAYCYCVVGDLKLANHYLKNTGNYLRLKKPDNPSIHLVIVHNVARVYQYESKYDSAMSFYNKAVDIYKTNHLKPGIEIVKVYNNIGSIYEDKANNRKALFYYDKALKLGLSCLKPDNIMISHIYNNIGLIESEMGNLQKALSYYRKDLAISEKILGKNHPDIAKSYVNIGNIFYQIGDLDNAAEYYNQALRIFIHIFGKDNQLIAQTYNNMGAVYYTEGNYEKAIEYFKKSMKIKEDILGLYNSDVAVACLNIGDTYYKLKKQKDAVRYMKKALAINLKLFGPDNPNIAPVYDSISQSYNDEKNYDQAIKYLIKELKIYKKSVGFHHPNTAYTLINIGSVYKDKKDDSSALQYFQHALFSLCPDFHNDSLQYNPKLTNIRSDNYLLQALNYKAETLSNFKQNRDYLITALKTYDLAIRLIDKIRIKYKTEGSKLLLGEQTHSIFEGGIKNCLTLYKLTGNEYFREKAFSLSDESKSNVLLESILDSKAKKFAGIPDSLLTFETNLKDSLTYYDVQIHKELARGSKTDSLKLVTWQNKLFAGNRKYNAFVSHLEKEYPRYYNLKFSSPKVSIRELQYRMLNNNKAIISYFIGDSTLYIFSVTKHHYQIKTEKIDSNFVRKIKNFRHAIVKSDYNSYTQKAYLLYKLLLAPASTAIQKKNLIIIPDGILGYLPFGALISQPVPSLNNANYRDYSKLHYVVLNHDISYNYSAMLLEELQNRPVHNDDKEFVGIAPVFNNTNYAGKDSLRYGFSKRLSPLPASEEEVKGIYNLFEKKESFWDRLLDNQSKILLHNQATESYVKSDNISHYRYIHFATHAYVNETNPELSGVILERKPGTKSDGILSSGEIYNLKLHADLVVLSACETALGKLVKGEGIMSLTRSFLYAGASNVIVSLWNVTDKSTSSLMIDLYGNLLQNQSITTSLADAKRTLIRKTAYSAPVYWSPFILTGQ